MADARSMLRASREARRITHPHASYTSAGKLLCNLCETVIKSDAAWQSHLHSSQHTLRQTRAQDAAQARPDTTKKRKASSLDSPPPAERKKPKPTDFLPGVESEDGVVGQSEGVAPSRLPRLESRELADAADDKGHIPNELAADLVDMETFERELAAMEASLRADTALRSGVTISAAPMTAGELAAQAREEQSTQRGRREAEMEAEKEDAARLMEDEFEEMEGLEERVRKLRERREALRHARNDIASSDPTVAAVTESGQPEGEVDHADEEDEDENDADLDGWTFGGK